MTSEFARGLLNRWQSFCRSQRAAGVIALLSAAIFGLMAQSGQDLDRVLGDDSPRAPATITEVRGDSYLVIEYRTAAGEVVTADLYESYWDPRPEVGDTITVIYDDLDPTYYVRDTRLGDAPWLAVMLWSFAGLFIVFGIAGLRKQLPDWLVNYRR